MDKNIILEDNKPKRKEKKRTPLFAYLLKLFN